jgi:hypothetical protein
MLESEHAASYLISLVLGCQVNQEIATIPSNRQHNRTYAVLIDGRETQNPGLELNVIAMLAGASNIDSTYVANLTEYIRVKKPST